MNDIWIVSETADDSYRLISKASEFGGHITAYVNGNEDEVKECFKYGAKEVIRIPLAEQSLWEGYALKLADSAKDSMPDFVLVSATKRGKTLAAYLGGLTNVPVITEVQTIELQDDKLAFSRAIYGGLAEKKLQVESGSVIATVVPGTFDKKVAGTIHEQLILTLDQPSNQGLILTERKEKEKTSVNLSDADVVIGVGRGFEKQENIKYAEQLASLMGGEIACSRPVTEDLHWLPEERYIGISGQVIKPNLYLCAGVSGQIQHVYGIRDAKTIVAINKDQNAPIFSVADYYIVGDLCEVLPAITEVLEK